MNRDSDEELERMPVAAETGLLGRKASASDRSGIRGNIAAFANDLAGRGGSSSA